MARKLTKRRIAKKQKLLNKRIDKLGGWIVDDRNIGFNVDVAAKTKLLTKPNWPFPTNTPASKLP